MYETPGLFSPVRRSSDVFHVMLTPSPRTHTSGLPAGGGYESDSVAATVPGTRVLGLLPSLRDASRKTVARDRSPRRPPDISHPGMTKGWSVGGRLRISIIASLGVLTVRTWPTSMLRHQGDGQQREEERYNYADSLLSVIPRHFPRPTLALRDLSPKLS
jgi:hypothetical protein